MLRTNSLLAQEYRARLSASFRESRTANSKVTLISGLGAIVTGAITDSDVAKWIGVAVASTTAYIGYRATVVAANEGVRPCVEEMADVERDWEVARVTSGVALKRGFDTMVGQLTNISKRSGCSEFAPNLLP